ncbi:carbon-nitrogen hydrolase family protein [Oceanirhabdus sp. W0125-5]|uniref:carbon-nitrogen hydrolase family protein n=1 Tax=Oceanirhabdus sp. W0125-5 TaxID=2999116 RepID=UPI0022F30273|nr:carbon-nitrogen hydrolase family protein [Oceanirhabdus sp. W0125-5]WBW95244.1 carbon-nitrogen hydrolase family protein [Oceanirhabdus sp. W0125-5]
MDLSVVVAQFPITFNIDSNLKYIISILEKSEIDDLVVLPEGALSGYSDDISFLENIDTHKLEYAMKQLKNEVLNRKIHLIYGSCIFENGNWYNAGICYSYTSKDFTYKKINLATHERGYFQSGNELPVYELFIKNSIVRIGIQLCREIRFPEQWRWLALKGAKVFVYLTNAINGSDISVWRSHLISRAAENIRFLISSNNANKNQHCPTMLISPSGEIIEEIVSDEVTAFRRTIELDEISNWYINQCRNDVIKLSEGEC